MTRIAIMTFSHVTKITKLWYGNGLVSGNSIVEDIKKANINEFDNLLVWLEQNGYHEPRWDMNPEMLDEFVVVFGMPDGSYLIGTSEDF